jgi:hypothetical protein
MHCWVPPFTTVLRVRDLSVFFLFLCAAVVAGAAFLLIESGTKPDRYHACRAEEEEEGIRRVTYTAGGKKEHENQHLVQLEQSRNSCDVCMHHTRTMSCWRVCSGARRSGRGLGCVAMMGDEREQVEAVYGEVHCLIDLHTKTHTHTSTSTSTRES